MAPRGGSWHHLLTAETQCPAEGLAAFLEGALCLHVQGHLLGRKDREGRESKWADRGKLLSPAREDLGEIPLSLQASISSSLKSNMLNDGKDCFDCWLLYARYFSGIISPTPQNKPRKEKRARVQSGEATWAGSHSNSVQEPEFQLVDFQIKSLSSYLI